MSSSSSSGLNQEMMELYQALILDHNKNPRNFGALHPCDITQEGFNPICGDHFHLYLNFDPDDPEKLSKIHFDGSGCAISKASASMMTALMQGKRKDEILTLFDEFHHLLTKKLNPETDEHHLGKLMVFASIWKYPARVKCAGLAWHTLKAALDGKSETIKTE